MIKKNYKGRCTKKSVGKSKDICKTYNAIQLAYLDVLQNDDKISEIQCNVEIESVEESEYTTDFVCTKTNGDLMVRECVFRKLLTKPMTIKLLDKSREFWLKSGVEDWGVVLDAEE